MLAEASPGVTLRVVRDGFLVIVAFVKLGTLIHTAYIVTFEAPIVYVAFFAYEVPVLSASVFHPTNTAFDFVQLLLEPEARVIDKL